MYFSLSFHFFIYLSSSALRYLPRCHHQSPEVLASRSSLQLAHAPLILQVLSMVPSLITAGTLTPMFTMIALVLGGNNLKRPLHPPCPPQAYAFREAPSLLFADPCFSRPRGMLPRHVNVVCAQTGSARAWPALGANTANA